MDDSELRRTKDELARTRARLERLEAAVALLTKGLSHDLRGPVSAMAGFAELLSMSDDDFSEESKMLLGRITANAVKVSELIGEVVGQARALVPPELLPEGEIPQS